MNQQAQLAIWPKAKGMNMNLRRLSSMIGCLALACMLTGVGNVSANNGTLDPTFGVGGKVQTRFGIDSGDWITQSSMVQADGKILSYGYRRGLVYALRLNANGSLDTSFGTGGRLIYPDIPQGFSISNTAKLLPQADGKLIVATSGYPLGSGQDADGKFIISRYLANGSLDPAFGTGGILVVSVSTAPYLYGFEDLRAILRQPDGKIIVAGSAFDTASNTYGAILTRVTDTGTIDTGFGTGGLVPMMPPSAGGIFFLNALSRQADGKIIAAGSSNFGGGDGSGEVRRLTAAGAADTTFGFLGGRAVFTASGIDRAFSHVAVRADGKIILAGTDRVGSTLTALMYQLTTSGSLDTTFSSDGIAPMTGVGFIANASLSATGSYDVLHAATLPASTWSISRFNAAGNLNTSFNGTGQADISFGVNAYEFDSELLHLTDGGFLIHVSGSDNTSRIALAKVQSNGALDGGFGLSGKAFPQIGYRDATPSAVATLADGRTVVVGDVVSPSKNGTEFAVATYTTDGQLDLTFGAGGLVTISMGTGFEAATGVAVQADGKIVVAGYSVSSGTTRVSTMRLLSSGALDTTYGTNGISHVAVANLVYTGDVRLQSDGKLIIAISAQRTGAGADLGVIRLMPSGVLDTTFGTSGGAMVTVSNNDEYPTSLLVLFDNKIVLAGYINAYAGGFTGIAQFTANGALDTLSFGSGGQTSLPGVAGARLFSAGGKLLVVGPTSGGVSATRLNSNGAVDTTYGTAGTVTVNGINMAFGAAVYDSLQESFIVAGSGNTGGDPNLQGISHFGVFKFNQAGLVSNFGTAGGTNFNFEGRLEARPRAIALASNNKIVVAGVSDEITANQRFAVARLIGNDSTPDPFTVNPKINVPLSTLVDSDPIVITGINIPTPLNGFGGSYSVNCTGTYVANFATLNPGDTVCVRVTSSSSFSTTVTRNFTIGGVAGSFSVTTLASTQTLTVAKSGTGSGTVTSSPAGISCGADCSESYATGTVVTLGAVASGGSVFTGWTGEGCSGTGNCVVTMSQARNVTANFTPANATLTVTWLSFIGRVVSAPAGIDCPGACTAVFPTGTQVTLTAMPVNGITFSNWSLDCAGSGSCVVTMNQARSVRAVYELTAIQGVYNYGGGLVSLSPGGVSCGPQECEIEGQFPDGSMVTITATASPGNVVTELAGATCIGQPVCQLTYQIQAIDQNGATMYREVRFGPVISSNLAPNDLNDDGRSDILWRTNPGGVGDTAAWLMNGTAVLAGAGLTAGSPYQVTHAGDFDGDGKADLAFQHLTAGDVTLFRMDGTTVVAGAGILPPGTGYTIQHLADFNGDGKADILWQRTDGAMAIWLMNGLTVQAGAGL
ncbi:MAG: FG-GAP-like repeat-containing protein, partial [Burkholderiales bacterium]|nr:FG-GAP-like repeat-containing protein [Burkholderiales bacterium]